MFPRNVVGLSIASALTYSWTKLCALESKIRSVSSWNDLDWIELVFGVVSKQIHRLEPVSNTYNCRSAAFKEVQAWWKQYKDLMAHFKGQSTPFVFDFKNLKKTLSGKKTATQSDGMHFMEHCAKRWETRESTYQLKRRRLKPEVETRLMRI